MHLAVTGFPALLLCFWNKFGVAATGYVSATPACSYDRSRIKRGDIFSRNIRSREIEAKSDKPARIFLWLFSLFCKLRAYVEYVSGILSTRLVALFRSLSLFTLLYALLHTATNRVSLRFFPFFPLISPLFYLFFVNYAPSGKTHWPLFADPG